MEQLEILNNLRVLPGKLPQDCVNLSSNDYLGLNEDIALKTEFINSPSTCDMKFSAVSSRLLTGNSDVYNILEDKIASAFNREACLVYNSGYHANIGILSSLAGKNDLLIADKLVHASIIDGMQLCKAEMQRYRHLDYDHLEDILIKSRNNYDQVFIITESIFSMDGYKADLLRLIELKKKYRCFIYLDEAHAFGVYGKNGLGIAEEEECINDCDFIVATFGKALASIGAFLICDEIIKRYLVNHSRSLIFTTALPPVNMEWTMFLFDRLSSFDEKRKHLKMLAQLFSQSLDLSYSSHIIPWITGTNESAVSLSGLLRENGIHVMPIRYPSVAKGTARLRFSLFANLSLSSLLQIPQIISSYEPKMD